MTSKQSESIRAAKKFVLGLDFTPADPEIDRAYIFNDADLGGMSFNSEEARQFSDCVDALHAAFRDDDLVDKSNVKSWFQEAILKAVDIHRKSKVPIEKRLDQSVSNLVTRMSVVPSKWEVHIPVAGLSVQGLPITFGRVFFRVGNESYKRKIRSEVKQVMVLSPDSPDVKKNFSHSVLSAFEENWRGRPVAQIEVKAITSEAAQAKGLKELQTTIDVINFFADILIDTGNGGRIYLPGETSRGKAFLMACQFAGNGACVSNNMHHYRVGSKSAFLLSKETTKRSEKFGFGVASAILKKPNKSQWEMRILSALQWAGRATSNRIVNEDFSEKIGIRREEAFLLYAVLLESLLLKKGLEITYKFSTRGAHLMG